MLAMNLPDRHDSSIAPRARPSSIKLWLGLFGAPLAWIAQVSLSEPLVAYACYPYQAPVSEPVWNALPAMLAGIGLACLAVALLSALMVWRLWRQSERQSAGIGKEEGLQRFLVHLGAMSSFIFSVAIVFNICAIWLVSPCSSWF